MARDPLSPPFHVNLCYGLRFLQLSVLVSPLAAPGPARAWPVRFDPAPPARKPKKNASAELWQAYRQQKKQQSLPRAGVQAMVSVRQSLDARAETHSRQLIVSGDASYTNRTAICHRARHTSVAFAKMRSCMGPCQRKCIRPLGVRDAMVR
jgi:hypothetical protein